MESPFPDIPLHIQDIVIIITVIVLATVRVHKELSTSNQVLYILYHYTLFFLEMQYFYEN